MYVMIDALSGHNDVHHVERCVCTASTSTRYDEVRVVVVDHLHSADGRVNLADATLLQNNLLVADLAKNEVLEVPAFGYWIVKNRLELCELLVHCYNDSYFHTAKIRKSW